MPQGRLAQDLAKMFRGGHGYGKTARFIDKTECSSKSSRLICSILPAWHAHAYGLGIELVAFDGPSE
jgi:hypothetical protein